MSEENNSSSMGWFLAGLGFGALVGVLFAPKTGSETREYIANRANEGKEKLSKQARESMGDWIDRGKEFADRQKQQVQSAFEAGRQAYRETTGDNGPQS